MNKEEYNTLREEMLQKIELHNKLIMFSITTSVAILAYAFSQKNPFLYLIPFCVIIPTSMRVIYYRSAIVKIAAYIIVFIEKNNNEIKWETRNHKINEITGRNNFISIFLKMNINYDCLVLSVVCYLLFIINYIQTYSAEGIFVFIINIIWPIFLLFIETAISVKGNGLYKTKQDWINEWEQVKDLE